MTRQQLPWMPSGIGTLRLDPWRAAWLWSMALVGCAWGLPALNPRDVACALGLVLLTLCLGHSVGLHRGVIHASYSAPPWLRGGLAYLFVLSGLGGPLSWARLHAQRDYWQNRTDCPRYFRYDHCLALDFWLNLHLRFVPRDAEAAEERLPPGALSDPWLRFLQRTWLLHNLALGALLYAVGGLSCVAIAGCLRIACGILGHWFVGYAAHAWGEQPVQLPGAAESGTNIWWLGVLSFGEGFHNNHHAMPTSPRMGQHWSEFDLGYVMLRGMAAAGLVRLPARGPAAGH